MVGRRLLTRRIGAAAVSLLLLTVPASVAAQSANPAGGTSGSAGEATAATAGTPLDPSQAGALSGSLQDWVAAIDEALVRVSEALAAGRDGAARTEAVRTYLDYYETIESFYGSAGVHASPALSERVAQGERRFHTLMQGQGSPELVEELRADVAALPELARSAGVPLSPRAPELAVPAEGELPTASSPEIAGILAELERADAAYSEGRPADAMRHVETAYLEGFEPLEARLPGGLVGDIEKLFHLTVRPSIASRAEPDVVSGGIVALGQELARADEALASEAGVWFGAVNSFAIIVREGLEAVLLIGALLAYLGAIGAGRHRRRQIWWGAGAGIAASVATWVVARTLIPIGGAGRELVEGITGLVAVVVLLYVSNWLAQKTYIQDWKSYLRDKVDQAVGTGSALAMAGLAFAAVYREGFETVLFYQALLFDVGAGPVLLGFVVGSVLIAVVGVGIIRLGLRLPLGKVFAVTNAILVYLAFTFLGKSIYNLQEAGLFAPHPVGWAPDSGVLRQVFGFYPTLETILAQAAFVAVVGGTYAVYRWKAAQRAEPASQPAAPESAPAS